MVLKQLKHLEIKNMKSLEAISETIVSLIMPNEAFKSKTFIEFYDKEQGYGLKGEYFDINDSFTGYLSFKGKIDILDEHILSWHLNSEKWNKAEFTVYKDGRYEVKTWWDAEFQKSLYGTED
jgi:hypothetical protein